MKNHISLKKKIGTQWHLMNIGEINWLLTERVERRNKTKIETFNIIERNIRTMFRAKQRRNRQRRKGKGKVYNENKIKSENENHKNVKENEIDKMPKSANWKKIYKNDSINWFFPTMSCNPRNTITENLSSKTLQIRERRLPQRRLLNQKHWKAKMLLIWTNYEINEINENKNHRWKIIHWPIWLREKHSNHLTQLPNIKLKSE